MTEYQRDVLAFLKDNGATEITVERRKHILVTWRYQGRAMQYHLCTTPSDHRGTKNAISQLRRLLGLTKNTKTVGRRREKKEYAEKRPVPVPVVTAMAEEPWRAKLRELRTAMTQKS